MKQLWAPWRIKYITKKDRGCIFCKKARERKDRANFILARGEYCFALLNIYPYNNGHIMVAPYRHVPDLLDLDEEEIQEMFCLTRKLERRLKDRLSPAGFNIGINIGRAAGAGYYQHIHLHLVPRWEGDTNFMPLITETKIISQSLSALYKILKNDG